MLKLTSAVKEHNGNQIILNPRYIVSIFPGSYADGVNFTGIYTNDNGSFEVKETIDQIYSQLKS